MARPRTSPATGRTWAEHLGAILADERAEAAERRQARGDTDAPRPGPTDATVFHVDQPPDGAHLAGTDRQPKATVSHVEQPPDAVPMAGTRRRD